MADQTLLQVNLIRKTYGPTIALNNVSFEIRRGEVRGLIGENGSGKSTVSSIISGLNRADSGTMLLEQKPYQPVDVIDANQQGVCMIVQEQSTISNISVAANIFIGKENMFSRHGVIDVRQMEAQARQALENIGVDYIKPSVLAKRLSFEDRKLVEIARALYMKPKILIVDETTTALSRSGRNILYGLMERICRENGTVIFISHDIEEVMERSHVLTVLRDGEMVASLEKSDFSEDRIRSLMVGREINDDYYRKDHTPSHSKEIAMQVDQISHGQLKDISFRLYKGEILGIGGLTECGMHELGRLLFGLFRPEQGRITAGDGQPVKNPGDSIRRNIGYMSKNRDIEALMTTMSIKDNICVSAYRLIESAGYISSRKEQQFANQWADEMNVKMASVNAMVSSLSGGNKQKVVFAKWLANDTELFIMDCPTRGIDVGVKAAIYRLMEEIKAQGKSIIMISEELPELLGMSDRILILKDGEISGEFSRDGDFEEQVLISSMI